MEDASQRYLLTCVLLDGRIRGVHKSHSVGLTGEHRIAWDALERVSLTDETLDLVSLTRELTRAGKLEDVGGVAWVAGLIDGRKIAGMVN